MRNRTNVFCGIIWALNLGSGMASHQPWYLVSIQVVIVALYAAPLWDLASKADKTPEESKDGPREN